MLLMAMIPPILVEIQNVAGDEFVNRVVGYYNRVYQEYGAAPVVLIIVISKTSGSLMNSATKDEARPFLQTLL